MRVRCALSAAVALAFLIGAPLAGAQSSIAYELVGRRPHDPSAFTQGLYIEGGYLFEGTGGLGRSVLRRIDRETGVVLQETRLPAEYFGEGVAALDGRIFQLTWQSGVAFVYDAASFEMVGRLRYEGEGWGLTEDGGRLIMSDGSSWLRFIDPVGFEEIGRIQVRDEAGPVDQLNELEFIDGSIFANVWRSDRILKIDPESGAVEGVLDLSRLVDEVGASDPEAVLNGIAYDEASGRMFVTGKLWPFLFEIRLDSEGP